MPNDAIDYINRDIVNVKNDLTKLKEVVFTGNGQPSLVQQVTQLREGQTTIRREVEGIKNTLIEQRAEQKNKNNLAWHFKTAIIVALITSFTAFYINWKDHNNPPQSDPAVIELTQQVHQLVLQYEVPHLQPAPNNK